jgi:cell wall-associated NlpC family hydrolase
MSLLLALALMIPASPSGVVVEPVANMYSASNETADVVSQAIFGTSVVLVEEKSGWVRVRTPDDYTGWMRLAALRQDGSTYAAPGKVVQVTSLFANVYAEPTVTKHAPLLTLPFEARLEVVAEQENVVGPQSSRDWIQVRLPDERTAWIERGNVESDPQPLSVQGTIEFAKRFIGLTYLWGGTTTFGFDCSGFTQMLVRQRGIVMPRDADLQAAWKGVSPVNRKKLRAGDLLFFGASPQRITHTGMYIGHGKFVHDTTHEHPGVQISRLADPHWTKLLVACRRLK